VTLKDLIRKNKQKKEVCHVKFPFLLIEPSRADNTNIYIDMQSDHKKCAIISNKELFLYGDLEVISLLKLNNGGINS
jgi:hypothetical protein